jgi:hypothetical protein
MGARVEQGGPQPVGLLQGQGPVALLLLLALLHGQRGLVGEGGQHPTLSLPEPRGPRTTGHHHQRPDHMLAATHRHRQGPTRLQIGAGRTADLHRGLDGGGGEALVEVVGHLAVDGGQAEAVARRQHDRAPGKIEQRAHGADHAAQGVVEAAVGDQAGGQVEQHPGLALPALGLDPPALAGPDQQADHDGHQEVDAERQVVLGVVDDDVVVGLQKQHVEGEEAEAGGGDAWAEAAGGSRSGHHQQVGQDHGGLGNVAPEGQEGTGDQRRTDHGHAVAERSMRPAHRKPPRDVHAISIGRPATQARDLTTSLRAGGFPSRRLCGRPSG